MNYERRDKEIDCTEYDFVVFSNTRELWNAWPDHEVRDLVARGITFQRRSHNMMNPDDRERDSDSRLPVLNNSGICTYMV